MPSTRTQIYLTHEQRQRLDALGEAEGRPLAALVREAIDRYLVERPDPDAALAESFGSLPDLELPPRSEWDRRHG